MNEMKMLEVIDSWLKNLADGEWEHHNGLTIESTDNPGWMIRINLPDGLFKNIEIIQASLRKLSSAEGAVKEGVLILYSPCLGSLIRDTAFILSDLNGQY
jgi:hypothetical protein